MVKIRVHPVLASFFKVTIMRSADTLNMKINLSEIGSREDNFF